MKQFHSLFDTLKHVHNHFPFIWTQYYSPPALDVLSLSYCWYLHMWPWVVRREGTPGKLVQTVCSSSMLIWRRFSWNNQLPLALCPFSSAPNPLTSRRLWIGSQTILVDVDGCLCLRDLLSSTNSAALHLVMCVVQNLGLPMTALSSLAVCTWPGFRPFEAILMAMGPGRTEAYFTLNSISSTMLNYWLLMSPMSMLITAKRG